MLISKCKTQYKHLGIKYQNSKIPELEKWLYRISYITSSAYS